MGGGFERAVKLIGEARQVGLCLLYTSSTLETLDRRALIHMVQSIRVRGKKELDITFTHEDEYKKALRLLALAAQQKDYEQRKVG